MEGGGMLEKKDFLPLTFVHPLVIPAVTMTHVYDNR
jgi:hypothetical protein